MLRRTALVAMALALIVPHAAASEWTDLSLKLTPQYGLDWDEPLEHVWSSPAVFHARYIAPGARLGLAQYYSRWEGRRLEMREATLTVAPSETFMLWVSRQEYLAKGRSGVSTFDVNASTFGVRALVRKPNNRGYGGVAVQLETVQPGTATATTTSSIATYNATKNYSGALIYSDAKGDFMGGYTSVRGAASGKSDVFELAMGKTLQMSGRMRTRLQGHLIYQNSSIGGTSVRNEVKPILFAGAAYKAASWLNVEADVTVMPSGIPMAGGRLTGISSFQVYNPTGGIAGLRTAFVAVGALRLLAHTRF